MDRRRLTALPTLLRSSSHAAACLCTLVLLVNACGNDKTETDTSVLTTGSGGAGTSTNKATTSTGPDLSTAAVGGAGTGAAGAGVNEGGMGMVSHEWGTTHGGDMGQAFLKALSVDASGNSIIVGAFTGAIDFGSGMALTSAGDTDVFVAKYGPGGAYLWAKKFGDANIQSALAVATDSNGDIALCGYFYGGLNFGGSNLSNSDQFANIYLAKLQGADGAHVFSKAFTNVVGTNDKCNGIAFDTKDNILITGKFLSEIDFGGGQITASGGNGDPDVYVAKFSSMGSNTFSLNFGGSANNTQEEQTGLDIATAIDDSFAITGVTLGPVDFGDGEISSGSSPRAYVARFDSNGTHQLSRVFGATDETRGLAVAFHESGDLFVAGSFDASITIEDTELKATGGIADIFVARYDANASLMYAEGFGGQKNATVYDMAIDPNGYAVVVGEFQEDFEVNSQNVLMGAGGFDAFVLKVGFLGNGYWGYAMGDAQQQRADGVAIDGNGDAIVAGNFSGTIDLGQGPTVGGSSDFFLAKFGP